MGRSIKYAIVFLLVNISSQSAIASDPKEPDEIIAAQLTQIGQLYMALGGARAEIVELRRKLSVNGAKLGEESLPPSPPSSR